MRFLAPYGILPFLPLGSWGQYGGSLSRWTPLACVWLLNSHPSPDTVLSSPYSSSVFQWFGGPWIVDGYEHSLREELMRNSPSSFSRLHLHSWLVAHSWVDQQQRWESPGLLDGSTNVPEVSPPHPSTSANVPHFTLLFAPLRSGPFKSLSLPLVQTVQLWVIETTFLYVSKSVQPLERNHHINWIIYPK